jgi:hypothetical protein
VALQPQGVTVERGDSIMQMPNQPLHRTAAQHILGQFETLPRAAVGELIRWATSGRSRS